MTEPTPKQVTDALAEGMLDDLNLMEKQVFQMTDPDEVNGVMEWLYEVETKARNLTDSLRRWAPVP